MKTRRIKVQEHMTRLKGRNRHSFKPKLILCGNWLQGAGIYAGKQVSVSVLKNQIIISSVA